jgi:hypothetical protein
VNLRGYHVIDFNANPDPYAKGWGFGRRLERLVAQYKAQRRPQEHLDRLVSMFEHHRIGWGMFTVSNNPYTYYLDQKDTSF